VVGALFLAACGPGAEIPSDVACDPMVFSSQRGGDWDVYLLRGNRTSRMTTGGTNVNPAWSPDGTRILFASDRDGDVDLYVMAADGSDSTAVTDNRELDSSADWSPDGSMIVFDRVVDDDDDLANVDATDFAQVFVAEFGTPIAGERQLTFGEPNAKPKWSPDGSQIAFLSWRDGNAEIYSMAADGTGQVNLSRDPGKDLLPAWSPDGSQIAFASDRDGQSAIYVMGADGSAPTRITDRAGPATNPAWSTDGRHILFTADDERVIYAVPVEGGAERRVTEGFVHDCRG
jgi:Tol biopolymer transport system component